MASATVAFNEIVVEALNEHNYRDWRSQIETYLLAKDVWGVVEAEPPESHKAWPDWRIKNAMALHTIKVCCGKKAFSFVREISTAKIAWEVLEKNFKSLAGTPLQETKVRKEEERSLHPAKDEIQAAFEDDRQIHNQAEDLESQANNGGNYKIKNFFKYVVDGKWDSAKKGLDDTRGASILTARCPKDLCFKKKGYPVNGFTALHLAASYGHLHIVQELKKMLTDDKEYWEIKEPTNGNTALHIAVIEGCWVIAKKLMGTVRLGVKNSHGETALHIAVAHEKAEYDFVKDLIELMNKEDLVIKDNEGCTALSRVLRSSNCQWNMLYVVSCMIDANRELLKIGSGPHDQIAVVEAAAYGRWIICDKLYDKMLSDGILPAGNDGDSNTFENQLLNICIRNPRGLGIAHKLLLSRPRLAFVKNGFGSYPILVLARLHFAFLSGRRLRFWQKWIYDRFDTSEPKDEEGKYINRVMTLVRRHAHRCHILPGMTNIYEMRKTHCLAKEVLTLMGKMENLTEVEESLVTKSIRKAIEHGHIEFVIHMCEAYPKLEETIGKNNRDILQYAIECRQERIYDYIYELRKERSNRIGHHVPDSQNTLLHIAANFSSLTRSHQDASLQMQRELLWFKEVESIVPFETRECVNPDGLTARELFTKEHAELKNEAEKSMKGTATSCTTVGALIVTIMFAVAFTIPGGTNQDTGLPIFMHKRLFRVFIVSDTISLISSATSVITCLGMLTSSYAEDDFLRSLPRKMMIGLFTLFISIATMMITFACALTLMLDGEPTIILPCIFCAGVPVLSFVWYLVPLLYEIGISTYGHSLFKKKDSIDCIFDW